MRELQIEVNPLSALKIIQISATLESRLGGPAEVVKKTNIYMNKFFDHRLIIFGNSDVELPNTIRIPTFRNNRYGFFLTYLNKLVRRNIRQSNVLLIHGFYLYCTLISIAIARKSRIFIMPHGSLENYQKRNSRVRKLIFDSCFRFLNKSRNVEFLVGSEEEIDGVSGRFKKNLVQVVGLGVDKIPHQYLHEESPGISLRLLCMSRVAYKKRIDLCIRAVERLRGLGVPAVLTIAGEGDETLLSELKQLAKELRLETAVDFVGFVEGEEKHRLYKESDILLLPSENENFAVAVAESIAHQVPVVVSDAVAMHSFVQAHNTGIVISQLSVDALVEAINSLNSNYHNKWKGCVNSKYLLDWDHVFNNWREALVVQSGLSNR